MKITNIGIVGGAGYTAGELIRILLRHPNAHVVWVHSNSNAGKPLAAVHEDLVGETDLVFSNAMPFEAVDVVFLCMGHGASGKFLRSHKLPENVKIIDLGNDFRLRHASHSFVYGLPELNKKAIQNANFIANCGCFATAIQLGLLPLAAHGQLQSELHIHAITGSTGAGQEPSPTTHFSWRNNNISVYKPFEHQHEAEILQSLRQLQPDFEYDMNFVPMRGDFARGIFASMYLTFKGSLEEAKNWFRDFYADAPFVHIVEQSPNLKQVVNTNKCLLYVNKYGDKLHIISILDNLTKGASGQAVQNMNLLFGYAEETGLYLKANVF